VSTHLHLVPRLRRVELYVRLSHEQGQFTFHVCCRHASQFQRLIAEDHSAGVWREPTPGICRVGFGVVGRSGSITCFKGLGSSEGWNMTKGSCLRDRCKVLEGKPSPFSYLPSDSQLFLFSPGISPPHLGAGLTKLALCGFRLNQTPWN
jgi:hypothetical protein